MAKSNLPAEAKGLIGNAAPQVQKYLVETVGIVELNAPDEETLWAIADRGEQMEMAGRLLTGLANRELSTRVEKRKLVAELKNRGKKIANFYYSIQVLETFEALPDESSVHAFAQLGFTKFRELLPWAPEERLALAAGESVRGLTLDDALQMSSRELAQHQKEWQAEHDGQLADLRKQNEELQNYNQGLEAQIAKMRRQLGVPSTSINPQLAALRDETAFLTEKLNEGINRIAEEGRRLLIDPNWREQPNAGDRMAVASFTYHLLQATIATGLKYLSEVELHFGANVISTIAPGARYAPDEYERLQALREEALKVASAEQQFARTRALDDNGVRGRRPGKSKK